MRAQVLAKYGDRASLELAELPDPVVRKGEVVVRVRAAGLNPADLKTIIHKPPFAPAAPAVLGSDFAGEVVDVGPGVEGFLVGDRVYGVSGGVAGYDGSFAELMRVNAVQVVHMPRSWSFREAAAIPLAGFTAFEALITRARLQAGETCLILGAAGGVGHIALQIARIMGAQVLATASSEVKCQLAKSLGAHECINYSSQDVKSAINQYTNNRGVNVILDCSGKDQFSFCVECAAQEGRIILLATRYTVDLTPVMFKGASVSVPFVYSPMFEGAAKERYRIALEQIAGWADAGNLVPLVDSKKFNLSQLVDAMNHLESGSASGKVVVDVD